MALLRHYEFDNDFADTYTIQAAGQVLEPTVAPNGIPGRVEIADWGGDIGHAMRATLYETDPPTAGATSYRSEVSFPHYNKGEYWFSYEIFIPAGDAGFPAGFDGTTSQVLCDFDQIGVNDDPVLGSHVSGETLAVKTHLDFVKHSGKQISQNEARLPRDKWVTVAIHSYWTDSGGFLELFCDGRFVYRAWGVQTIHADDGRAYMKVGVYNYNQRAGYGMARAYYRNVRFNDADETLIGIFGDIPSVPRQTFAP